MFTLEGNELLWLLDVVSEDFVASCLLNSIDDFARKVKICAMQGKARLEGKDRKS